MAGACTFLAVMFAAGILGAQGIMSPSYSATFTREQRANHRAPAPAAAPKSQHALDGDLREGRLLILQTLSALAGQKFGKLLHSSSPSSSASASSSASSASLGSSLQDWFTNPFNVTVSLGVANGTNPRPTYNPTPIYNAFPATSAANVNYAAGASASAGAALVPSAYRGEVCNANAWPPCTSGVTPCNNNDLPACYFAWPPCNSNVLPPCGAVLAGVACNNNSLPYCVDAGVPCNSNDLNYCINAPSPCNDNNWPYCPGFGALAASFDGVVNGVVVGGAGSVGPNGPFYSPNTNTGANGVFFGAVNTGTNAAVNSPFFTPTSKVGAFLDNGQSGSNGAFFVKNNILSPQLIDTSKSGDRLEAKPNVMSLTGGLFDVLANTNSTPPWTFELTRPGHRTPKPLNADIEAVQKYMVAIAPMLPPTLGVEALNALGQTSPPPRYEYDDYLGGEEEEDFEDDFGLQLFGEKSDKKRRGPRKPLNKTRLAAMYKSKWNGSMRPFKLREKHSKKGVRPSSAHAPGVHMGSKRVGLQKIHDVKALGPMKGLPERFQELAKISKVTFGGAAPKRRSWNLD